MSGVHFHRVEPARLHHGDTAPHHGEDFGNDDPAGGRVVDGALRTHRVHELVPDTEDLVALVDNVARMAVEELQRLEHGLGRRHELKREDVLGLDEKDWMA